MAAADALVRVPAAAVFVLFVDLLAFVAAPLLALVDFDFVVDDFAVDDFAAADFSGLAFLLTSLGNPLESASITMEGAALEDAAFEEAVLGDAALD